MVRYETGIRITILTFILPYFKELEFIADLMGIQYVLAGKPDSRYK